MERKSDTQAPETNAGNNKTYAPPPGPPPPIVPDGWIAQYDPIYRRFYYVNLATQRSQWEKPPGTVDAPTRGAESTEAINTHCRIATPPTLVSQISPPEEKSPHRVDYCNQQMAEREQQKKTGFASQMSSFFKHGSSRPEPYQQNQPLAYYSPQIAHPQAAYMPQQRSSGMSTAGSAALGAGGGLLAGMALENAISNHGDERYEQGFEDGADYIGEDRSGALEQLEEESIQGEGVDTGDYGEDS
ncbi:hypothetical protein L873DRAFT_1827754 [Choiromyces venosus 120613-1]|uniref:WW domain-containing protein n=1 Tax=Choiromyces venosus 120613-1 TaxID=1336337 RepID=A0A3N4JT80_9PEZI|nr:hypothetical protein L873DRAFT_1827754 [Choiromyces venosus 120613-1]